MYMYVSAFIYTFIAKGGAEVAKVAANNTNTNTCIWVNAYESGAKPFIVFVCVCMCAIHCSHLHMHTKTHFVTRLQSFEVHSIAAKQSN